MRLTVAHFKPLMTGLVVALVAVLGVAYLVRLAVQDNPAQTPAADSGSAAASPESGPAPSATASSIRTGPTQTSPPRTPATRTASPTQSRREPSRKPTSATVPHVVVAGPTVDNIYPDDTGCHVFWIRTQGLDVTVVRVGLSPGPSPSTVPSPDPSDPPDANPMRADFVACKGSGGDAPLAREGCHKGMIISTKHGCGVRPFVRRPTRSGTYHGTLKFGLSTLCKDRRLSPCAAISSPYPPSAARPVRADWTLTCAIELEMLSYDTGDPIVRPCRL
jgi:hypothetical protein